MVGEILDKSKLVDVGDSFFITIRPEYCINQDKIFVVEEVNKSGTKVSYQDIRETVDCLCIICSPNSVLFSQEEMIEHKKFRREIIISAITIVESRIQRERRLKIEEIVGK